MEQRNTVIIYYKGGNIVGEIMLVSQQEMYRRLNMTKALEITEKAYRALGEKDAKFPAKITMDLGESDSWPAYGGHINAMPAYVGYEDIVGVKWAGGFENNKEHGLPYGIAALILNNPHNGEVIAFMDGTHITSIRTGAASGVAVKYLSRKDSKVLGIVGAGLQGRMNLEAILQVRDINLVKIADLHYEAAVNYAKEMSDKFGVEVIPVKDYREVSENSDIVLTATNGRDILVKREWLKEGSTVLGIGSYPELDERVYLTSDKVVCDSWEQCSRRGQLPIVVNAGKFTRDNLYAEISEIVSGRKAARENNNELICVCLVGVGVIDIACAARIYKEMKEEGDYPTFKLR